MPALILGLGPGPKKKSSGPPPIGGKPVSRGMDTIVPARARKAPAAEPELDVEAPAPKKEKPAGGEGVIQPEAVCYRPEAETCGRCEYNDGGNCSRLQIPVSDGDGCNLFSGGQGGDEEAMEAPDADDQQV